MKLSHSFQEICQSLWKYPLNISPTKSGTTKKKKTKPDESETYGLNSLKTQMSLKIKKYIPK